MSKVYVYSDPHYFHWKICEYESRPFTSVEEMNEFMIKTYNSVVKGDDKVYFLGDVGFGGKEELTNVISQLNGKKILIMGNHDRRKTTSWWREVGFEEVIKYPICVNEFVWLSHEPMYMNSSMPYINVHGHTHSKRMEGLQHFNACVECLDYKPIEIIKILKLIKEGKNAI